MKTILLMILNAWKQALNVFILSEIDLIGLFHLELP